MSDLLIKEDAMDVLDYIGGWSILLLTNKGHFISPNTYPSKDVAENEIVRLKASHAKNPIRQIGGIRDIVTKAYFAIPVDGGTKQ